MLNRNIKGVINYLFNYVRLTFKFVNRIESIFNLKYFQGYSYQNDKV